MSTPFKPEWLQPGAVVPVDIPTLAAFAEELCRVNQENQALRQALETEQEPVANEVPLNIIRWWPEGFADRLEHVWKDLIGFIPNYKLYDLQRMLAEFGFTMKIYEGAAPSKQWVGLTDEEIQDLSYLAQKIDEGNSPWFDRWGFAKSIEAKLREKNT